MIDGEIVVVDRARNRLDFEALQQRIHPATSRVNLLAHETPASFVAFDLLALGDEDLTQEPMERRRAELEEALGAASPPVHVTPLTRDRDVAQQWFEQFEGAGLEGLIAKAPDLRYQPDKRVMAKIKHERTADCVVAGYRMHKSGPDAIGSLPLGLYDSRGMLASVGVVGALPMVTRRALFAELQPLVTGFEGHPWNWAAHSAGERTPRKKRADLRLVGLGLVVTRDGGVPLVSHAYPGNRPDLTQFTTAIRWRSPAGASRGAASWAWVNRSASASSAAASWAIRRGSTRLRKWWTSCPAAAAATPRRLVRFSPGSAGASPNSARAAGP